MSSSTVALKTPRGPDLALGIEQDEVAEVGPVAVDGHVDGKEFVVLVSPQ